MQDGQMLLVDRQSVPICCPRYSRQHVSTSDCPEDKMEVYQICSIL